MLSIIEEIKKIRTNSLSAISNKNINRYSVVFDEKDGTHTSYCASVPILNISKKKIVAPEFRCINGCYIMEGSNSEVSVSPPLTVFKSESGIVSMVTEEILCATREKLQCSKLEMIPTANGVLVIVPNTGVDFVLHLKTHSKFKNIYSTTKCFSIMKENFTPLLTISPIGVSNDKINIQSPVKISYQQGRDNNFAIVFSPAQKTAKYIMFEINAYEPKLFQDTTVDSENPIENNAFGGTAFIGNSKMFGEQWLYLRPDISKIPYISGKIINYAHLYIPRFCSHYPELEISKAERRFCSFGSTWSTKVNNSGDSIAGTSLNYYEKFDLSKFLISEKNQSILQPEGLILKSCKSKSGFSVIGTGDSYWRPQILEINYK